MNARASGVAAAAGLVTATAGPVSAGVDGITTGPAAVTPLRPERGYSLIEAMVAVTVFLALLTAVISLYTPARLLYTRGERRADAQQNARLAMAEMVREIRMAGYFPENFSATPPSPAVANRVLLATDEALTVHGDLGGTGTSTAFHFCLDGRVLRRGSAPRDDAAAYTCSSGQILAENVIDIRFTYYGQDGNPLPDPPSTPYLLDSQPAGAVPDFSDMTQRDSIRRLVITLTAEFDSPQRGPTTYSLTSDVWLRNGG